MGRQIRPSPVFVVFISVMALSGVTAGIVSAGPSGTTGAPPGNHATVGSASVSAENPTCERCHATISTNTTQRNLSNEVTNMPDHEFELDHGDNQWCLDCHAAEDRNELRLPNGSTVAWTEENETEQCAGCHGPVYQDWQQHIHGKWTGSWQNATPAKQCTDCHDPHDPEFHAIEPEPAPEKPPHGPTVAQSIMPFGYYLGIGTVSGLAMILIGYAGMSLRRE
jgi:predicted CxxxxCH...CXXCH cytochrome family protein